MALRGKFTKEVTSTFVIYVTIWEKTVIFAKKVIKITFRRQIRLDCCCLASFNSLTNAK